MRELSTEGLLEQVRTRGAVLFGTGFVAGELQAALAAHGLWDRVTCCVVSSPDGGEDFHGVPVAGPEGLPGKGGELVLAAVHNAVLPEVGALLDAWCPDQWTWAYPHLHQLLYGAPVGERRVPVRELLHAQGTDARWLAVRALALRDPSLGRDAYLKAQGLHCSPQTAALRLAAFDDLARAFGERGFDGSQPLLVDEDLNVIDGLHRLVLAWHHGMYDVPCRVVARSDAFGRLVGDDNRLVSGSLARAGLSQAQLEAIERQQGELLSNSPLVSVILPAYNVEGYLDQCMETLVAQTMPDLEALLVNDGSTDGTLGSCRAWEARDPRIRVIDKPNGGVSSARNAGMDAARGRWLAFVDPDDWLEPTYLEELLAGAARNGADRVECDLWRCDGRTGHETWRECGGRMGVPFSREEQMRYGPTGSYKAITRSEVWRDHGVRFPDCPYESPAVYALVVALARKLAWVNKPLYHYRRFRPGSLVETAYASNGGGCGGLPGVDAMRELAAGFERHGLVGRYDDVLQGIVAYRLSDMLAVYHHRLAPSAFDELCEAYLRTVGDLFGEGAAARYVALGGYNLNRMLLDLPLLQDPRSRLNFSSVVALVDEPLEAPVTHPNRYRELMLRRELSRDVWRILREGRPAYLFWDLMEERHDIGEVAGRRVTLSDAFEDSSLADAVERRVPRASDECHELWERAADEFLARVGKESPQTRVVVVADHLADRVGTLEATREFDGADSIRATNALFDGYYDYLRERHPGLVMVDVRGLPDYFCDERHEYGVVPEHLNSVVNEEIARLVGEAIS